MEIQNISSFLDYFRKVRERTNRLLQVVPPEHINFTYKQGKFTIADEIRHIAAMERYMFAENVAGRRSSYSGCGKELADGYENVMRLFDELHRQSLIIFTGFTDEDLKKKCITPGSAEIVTWKWLRAMVEHEIHHRAQLYIYLNMLDVKTPPMFGLTAEEVVEKSLSHNKTYLQ